LQASHASGIGMGSGGAHARHPGRARGAPPPARPSASALLPRRPALPGHRRTRRSFLPRSRERPGRTAAGRSSDIVIPRGNILPTRLPESSRRGGARTWRQRPASDRWSAPLVLPGTTACLRLLDLAGGERTPQWPLILAQLSGGGADHRLRPRCWEEAVATQARAGPRLRGPARMASAVTQQARG